MILVDSVIVLLTLNLAWILLPTSSTPFSQVMSSRPHNLGSPNHSHVITLNIHGLSLNQGDSEKQHHLLTFVKTHSPAILCLQEIYKPSKENLIKLANSLNMWVFWATGDTQ